MDRVTIGHGQNETTWSPDGATIAFTSNKGGTWGIWTVPSSGGVAEHVVDWPGNTWAPTWSPDAKQLAFNAPGTPSERGSSSTVQVWILSVESGTFSRLIEGSHPAWSPDGSEICFAREGDIWKVAIDGGAPMRLLKSVAGAAWPRWSPDGSQIQFSRGNDNDIWIADVSNIVK